MGGLGHCFNHIKYYISLSPHERIYTDWWYTYPSEKYERDDYSKYMEKHMFQPTNQFGYLESHWPSFFRGL